MDLGIAKRREAERQYHNPFGPKRTIKLPGPKPAEKVEPEPIYTYYVEAYKIHGPFHRDTLFEITLKNGNTAYYTFLRILNKYDGQSDIEINLLRYTTSIDNAVNLAHHWGETNAVTLSRG